MSHGCLERCRLSVLVFFPCVVSSCVENFSLHRFSRAPPSSYCCLNYYYIHMTKIIHLKDIVPAATNTVNAQFILLEKGGIARDGKEMTCPALVADETASVHFQMWGSECEIFEPGDIIRLADGIFSYHKNNLVLRAGKRGKAEKVGEFTMLFVETPNMSEIRWARDPNNPKKFVQEAIVSPHSRIFGPSK
ncbi:SOSS complex subunit B homolog isoform X1 [Zingiber officinale]|nr:SOSS complex subunit B homolog isoform X1 [Zingiber officinale]XP_042452755.1 SOSS complex subunit B homolog isoform X1 [Zingiber officinale]